MTDIETAGAEPGERRDFIREIVAADIAAGLLFGLLAAEPTAFAFKVFFLACVIIAGVFGALTVSRRILLIQAVPAAIALVAVVLAQNA